ncbi:MAG: IcmT/TraK family protein [Gammaproteobacteria bacterium]
MAKPINPTAHWRDSSRSVRFFFVDYRALFPLLILIFLPRLWTFGVAVFGITFFMILERYGFTVNVFLRLARGLLGGPFKIARPWWYRARV